jgi:peroxiredoxin
MQKPPIPIGKPAPLFVASDANNKKSNPVKEKRGTPFLLFFACGCSWCADFAKLWAAEMRGRGKKGVPTIVVFAGSGDEAVERARQATLGKSTQLFPDPTMHITDTLYHADPCPRLFVIDKNGIVRYVNSKKGEEPQKAPAELLLARVLDTIDALNRLTVRERLTTREKRLGTTDKGDKPPNK